MKGIRTSLGGIGPRRLQACWGRLKRRVFPPQAVTFHLQVWSRGALVGECAEKAAALARRHGFAALVLLHGNALESGKGATLVIGPPGVGKSTVCRELVAEDRARLVEDGLVLVGRRGDDWMLVETGTLAVLQRASLIAGRIRGVAARRPGSTGAPAGGAGPGARLHGRAADVLAFRLAVLFARRPDADFQPRLLAVERVIQLEDPREYSYSLVPAEGRLLPLADPGRLAPARVEVVRLSSDGSAAQLRERIRAAVLAGTADARSVA